MCSPPLGAFRRWATARNGPSPGKRPRARLSASLPQGGARDRPRPARRPTPSSPRPAKRFSEIGGVGTPKIKLGDSTSTSTPLSTYRWVIVIRMIFHPSFTINSAGGSSRGASMATAEIRFGATCRAPSPTTVRSSRAAFWVPWIIRGSTPGSIPGRATLRKPPRSVRSASGSHAVPALRAPVQKGSTCYSATPQPGRRRPLDRSRRGPLAESGPSRTGFGGSRRQ